MYSLKQSTAVTWVFYLRDSTGDPVTGASSFTITISKAGAALASATPVVTELAGGLYTIALTASHTDTLGALVVRVQATGAVDSFLLFQVSARLTDDIPTAGGVSTAVWDALLSNYDEAGSTGLALASIVNKVQAIGQIITVYPSLTQPVGESLLLVRGDDYTVASGQPLEWTNTGWPDLTGATIAFRLRRQDNPTLVFEKAGTVLTASSVRVQITSSDTGNLPPTTYQYEIQATLAGGSIRTIVRRAALELVADIR